MTDWINDRTPRPGPAVWHVVVPVKDGPSAKSRLRAPDGVDHPDLARALALDTLAAAFTAVGADQVTVVTSEHAIAGYVRAAGGHVVRDLGDGLNSAVAAGIRATGHEGAAVAVLLGDLPALRPEELRAALRSVRGRSAFVPDAEGAGTVLLAATDPTRLRPRFGPGSAAAHEADGHPRLDLHLPGLRRDVDDEQSLSAALGLGVGPHTAELLAHLLG